MLDCLKERVSERLRMRERHHVAGALDQRVPCAWDVAPDDGADRVVHCGCLRSLDDVHVRRVTRQGPDTFQPMLASDGSKAAARRLSGA